MTRPAPQRIIASALMRAAEADAADAAPDPSYAHGTRYGYQHRGCRCDDCRAWEAARQRAKRTRRQQRERAGRGLDSA